MKQVRRRHGHLIFYVSSALLCLVLFTTWLTFGLFARYAASDSDTSAARVAVMASTVEVTLDNTPLYPGANLTIPVVLTNAENGVVCEVAQRYSFSVQTLTGNLPLTVTIYTDAACTTAATLDASGNVVGTFDAGMSQEDSYYIKVAWDSASTAASYASEIDYLRIRVVATQID